MQLNRAILAQTYWSRYEIIAEKDRPFGHGLGIRRFVAPKMKDDISRKTDRGAKPSKRGAVNRPPTERGLPWLNGGSSATGPMQRW